MAVEENPLELLQRWQGEAEAEIDEEGGVKGYKELDRAIKDRVVENHREEIEDILGKLVNEQNQIEDHTSEYDTSADIERMNARHSELDDQISTLEKALADT
ncbi:hypothetical protein [Salinisphaera sp. S4-8]|uniref:hypothetical protein n=1 Tax=Salinisphaera sp. S4-8 TaxID=633357 RepID=UPI0033419E6D